MTRFAVLVSGSGTNLQAIIDAHRSGDIAGDLALVISNRPEAYALERARGAGVIAECLDHRAFPNREAYDRALIATLEAHDISLIVLAGFMRIFSEVFVNRYAGKIVNIHPSLLPAFPGIHAPERALEAGVKLTGVTVHFVDSGVDTGPIIAQEAVPLSANETADSLATKIHRVEHTLYPRVIDLVLRGAVHAEGRHVRIDGEDAE